MPEASAGAAPHSCGPAGRRRRTFIRCPTPLMLWFDYEPSISKLLLKGEKNPPITFNTGVFEQVFSKSIECRFERH